MGCDKIGLSFYVVAKKSCTSATIPARRKKKKTRLQTHGRRTQRSGEERTMERSVFFSSQSSNEIKVGSSAIL